MKKARVELDIILEIEVNPDSEDEAGAMAENIADGIAWDIVHWYESLGDNETYIPSWGVRCIDVEPADYE